MALQMADRALELAAVMGVLVDLPGAEHALAELEAVLAELFLGGEAFGVRGEVALQVRPAELAAAQWQVPIGPPAIGGHDRVGVGRAALGVILVAVAGDRKKAWRWVNRPHSARRSPAVRQPVSSMLTRGRIANLVA